MDEACFAELKIAVELPGAAARVRRRFEPAAGRQDIVAAILVDVARADTVPEGMVRHLMCDELSVARLVPRQWRVGIAEFGEHLAGLAIVIEIHDEGELHIEARLDRI